jgi:ribosomal protein S18 acetylase RimI-like enzyme
MYLAVGTALHSEDLQPYQVYRCLYNNELSRSWVRPLEMFHERLESKELRFTPIARVRVMVPEDEREVLAFGYEAWGGGQTLEEFIEHYATDRNHLRGTGYVLERMDGTRVAGLNTLRFARHRVGLARLATSRHYRGQGFGSLLMQAVMEILRSEDPEVRCLLFSEISPLFYEKLGFRALPEGQQRFLPAVAMISGDDATQRIDDTITSSYF